jgi:flagellar protein FliO/FliZ
MALDHSFTKTILERVRLKCSVTNVVSSLKTRRHDRYSKVRHGLVSISLSVLLSGPLLGAEMNWLNPTLIDRGQNSHANGQTAQDQKPSGQDRTQNLSTAPNSPSNQAVIETLRHRVRQAAHSEPTNAGNAFVSRNTNIESQPVQSAIDNGAVSGQTVHPAIELNEPKRLPTAAKPIPLAPSKKESSLKLAPPSSAEAGSYIIPERFKSLTNAGGALALVLGFFLLFVWLFRRGAKRGNALLPPEVFEVLGRAPLAPRSAQGQVYLVRLGHKLVLLSATSAGVETLSEIDNPLEVQQLTDYCNGQPVQNASAAIEQIVPQFTRAPSGTAARAEMTRTFFKSTTEEMAEADRLAALAERERNRAR